MKAITSKIKITCLTLLLSVSHAYRSSSCCSTMSVAIGEHSMPNFYAHQLWLLREFAYLDSTLLAHFTTLFLGSPLLCGGKRAQAAQQPCYENRLCEMQWVTRHPASGDHTGSGNKRRVHSVFLFYKYFCTESIASLAMSYSLSSYYPP